MTAFDFTPGQRREIERRLSSYFGGFASAGIPIAPSWLRAQRERIEQQVREERIRSKTTRKPINWRAALRKQKRRR